MWLEPVPQKVESTQTRQRFTRRLSLIRQRKRWHAVDNFAANTERLAAAGDDLDIGRIVQKFIRKMCAGFDEMFAVVKNEQKVLRPQIIDHDVLERNSHLRADIQHRCNRLQNECRVCKRGKLDEPNAVLEIWKYFCAKLN